MVLILRYLKIKGVNSLKNSINASKMTKIIMDAIVYFARLEDIRVQSLMMTMMMMMMAVVRWWWWRCCILVIDDDDDDDDDNDDDDFYTYLWIYKVKLRSTSIQRSVKIPEVSKLGTQNTGNVGLQNEHKLDLTASVMQNKRNSISKVYWPVASSNFQVLPALCLKCQ